MNTKALITVLALVGSSSSLAMARPATTPTASINAHATWSFGAPVRAYPVYTSTPTVRTVVRTHRDDWNRGYDNRGYDDRGYSWQPRSSVLADGLTFNAGEYRKDVVLQGRGRFNNVVIQAQGGRTFLEVVKVEFMGGAVQTIPVNRTLCDNESMTINLDGSDRAINRILVYRSDGPSSISRFTSPGEFSVIGL